MTTPKCIPPAVVRRIWQDRTRSLDVACQGLGITRQGLAYKAKVLGLGPRGSGHDLQKNGSDEDFRRMWAEGVPVREMQAVLGYATHQAVSQRRKTMGLPARTRRCGMGKGRRWEETSSQQERQQMQLAARMAETAARDRKAVAAYWARAA
jgi:hypothetical protein